ETRRWRARADAMRVVQRLPQRVVADGVGEPAAPKTDLAAKDAAVGVDQGQSHRRTPRAPLDAARAHAAGGADGLATDALDHLNPAQEQAKVEASAREDDGFELGAGDFHRHGRCPGQSVGDSPLRITEITRAGET